jgi:enoyl reductase-like protein
MTKEKKTAQQLSQMLSAAAGIDGLQVMVREDHAYGWQPTVFSSLGDPIGCQRRVEQIAHILRNQYDLAR